MTYREPYLPHHGTPSDGHTITAGSQELMRQGAMTAYEFLHSAVENIDFELGKVTPGSIRSWSQHSCKPRRSMPARAPLPEQSRPLPQQSRLQPWHAVLKLSDANLADRCHVRVSGFDIDSNKLHLKPSQAASSSPQSDVLIEVARIQSAHP